MTVWRATSVNPTKFLQSSPQSVHKHCLSVRPDHSLMLSSHHFLAPPLLLLLVPWRLVIACKHQLLALRSLYTVLTVIPLHTYFIWLMKGISKHPQPCRMIQSFNVGIIALTKYSLDTDIMLSGMIYEYTVPYYNQRSYIYYSPLSSPLNTANIRLSYF